MINVRHLIERINIASSASRLSERRDMRDLTSFRVGGPAELFAEPQSWNELFRLKEWAADQGVGFTLIGGGANILVADEGIPGLTATTTTLAGISRTDEGLCAEAGAEISAVSAEAAELGLSGLEFIYRMPGSVGGAVWMNARCYGVSISERLAWVDYIDESGHEKRYRPREEDFAYKRSPFQMNGRGNGWIITRACFRLKAGDSAAIRAEMEEHARDREEKGHFRYPCAGSVFKNNRDFGAPSGKLIDALGLKGTRIGDAMIAPFHGNIIINTGSAKAKDILSLIELTERAVREAYGFDLEREVLLVGDWPGSRVWNGGAE